MEQLKRLHQLLSLSYPQIANIPLIELPDNNVHGGTTITPLAFMVSKSGNKKISTACKIESIAISLTNPDRSAKSPEQLVMTFLHEIAHSLTPIVLKLCKKKWIHLSHDHMFYDNYRKVVQTCITSKFLIITPPSGNKSFTELTDKYLKHLDTLTDTALAAHIRII